MRRCLPSTRALLLGVLLVAAATGCGPAPGESSAAELLEKAVTAQGRLRSVQMSLDSDIDLEIPGDRRSISMSYDGSYEEPDRWHLDIRSPGGRSEVIILGEKAYVKAAGSDTWAERRGDLMLEASSPDELVSSKYLESASSVELIDGAGGRHHLKLDLDMVEFSESFELGGLDPSSMENRKAVMELWINRDSMYIEKAAMSFSSGISPGVSGRIEMSMEVRFFEQNEPVSIEPPEGWLP